MPEQTIPPSALLKQETASAHQQTEKALVARIKAIAGSEDYCSLLACLYGYFSPVEQMLEPELSGLFPDQDRRRKSTRLKDDIHLLDPSFPFRFASPVIDRPSRATALGYAYVMEGSVLGGAHIKKMISGRFPEIPQSAFSFFSGYGAENADMWNAFLDVLNRELAAEAGRQQGLEAARHCFAGMEHWIGEWYGQPARNQMS